MNIFSGVPVSPRRTPSDSPATDAMADHDRIDRLQKNELYTSIAMDLERVMAERGVHFDERELAECAEAMTLAFTRRAARRLDVGVDFVGEHGAGFFKLFVGEVVAEALVPLVEELYKYQHLTPHGTPQ